MGKVTWHGMAWAAWAMCRSMGLPTSGSSRAQHGQYNTMQYDMMAPMSRSGHGTLMEAVGCFYQSSLLFMA